MERTKTYWPVLKGKKGEFMALGKLEDGQKDCIMPVIEIVPPQNKELKKHLDTTIKYCMEYWGKGRTVYFDGCMVQDYNFLLDGSQLIEYTFNEFRSADISAIPVISNATGPDYNEIVKSIAERDNHGVCLRIFCEQHVDVNSDIEDLLSFLNLQRRDCDLLIDLRDIRNQLPEYGVDRVKSILINLYQPDDWRSLVISGSSFPIDLTEFRADQIHRITRNEWVIWNAIIVDPEILRKPSFSDYAISHPNINEIDSPFPNASASIRYTKDSEFAIYRGRGTKQFGYEQFYDISETLISSTDYYGIDHCAGDKFIYKCATQKKETGNLTSWRWIGTVHHIVCVLEQLRQL